MSHWKPQQFSLLPKTHHSPFPPVTSLSPNVENCETFLVLTTVETGVASTRVGIHLTTRSDKSVVDALASVRVNARRDANAAVETRVGTADAWN